MDKTVGDLVNGQEIVEMPGTATVRESGRVMTERNVGSVLVTHEGQLLGIFTERDALRIFVATRRNADLSELRDVMTREPVTIDPDTSVTDALKLMNDNGFRHLPVVKDGQILGVVSRRLLT